MNKHLINFIKYHGTGNDFVLFDRILYSGLNISPESAKKICDRHFGIGADGVLIVSRINLLSRHRQKLYEMTIINSDGSIAEMCGNGIRCCAHYIRTIYEPDSTYISISTGAGIKECYFENNLIRVDMGKPDFVSSKSNLIFVENNKFSFFKVSVGNPHAVIFSDKPLKHAKKFGKIISENTDIFPERTNVEFIKFDAEKQEVNAVIYERGCAITMACGTGATAIGALLTEKNNFPSNIWLKIKVPGGILEIMRNKNTGSIFLRGDAIKVFDGTLIAEQFDINLRFTK